MAGPPGSLDSHAMSLPASGADSDRLAFVVTTLGRLEPLRKLLATLTPQTLPGDQVVLVAQDQTDRVRALAVEYADAPCSLTVTTSPRGAARGRTAGVDAVTGNPVLHFPNDTTWFPEGSVAAVRALAPRLGLGAITVVDEHGPKFVLPEPGTALDRWNVWRVIEMGLLVRRELFVACGGFDPEIGTGAPTPWQAGEVTDFLLRAMDRGLAEGFLWAPADVAVGGIGQAAGLTPGEHRRKVRAYNRGTARILARWRYPLWWRLAFVAAGALVGVRHGSHHLSDGWWAALGRAEGSVGRVLGGRDLRAVSR